MGREIWYMFFALSKLLKFLCEGCFVMMKCCLLGLFLVVQSQTKKKYV
jgi:hypothetical protein